MASAITQLGPLFQQVRDASLSLVDGLSAEDMMLQSMEDASPAKWHLAHTTWFFETLVLTPYAKDYQCFDPNYAYLFNSYYEALGARHPRPSRGLLSRPSLDEVLRYRAYINQQIIRMIDSQGNELPAEVWQRLELGIHHEMQHQELLITDQLHGFSKNRLQPVWKQLAAENSTITHPTSLNWDSHSGGLADIGHNPATVSCYAGSDYSAQIFAYDCETPVHKQHLAAFNLATRPVTNREWLDFMADGGYQRPQLWLSDGWARVVAENWESPLYWIKQPAGWQRYTPHGLMDLQPEESVCHISYFEADAYARWAGARLPSEAEWEFAARGYPVEGRFMEQGVWHPQVCGHSDEQYPLQLLFGNVWEWTLSPYLAYPGFKPLDGALGEYNGKFMCGQFVLKGGAFTSPQKLLRASYRNFFYPHQRWQATGVRLANHD